MTILSHMKTRTTETLALAERYAAKLGCTVSPLRSLARLHRNGSVVCFVDLRTGDVRKARSWKSAGDVQFSLVEFAASGKLDAATFYNPTKPNGGLVSANPLPANDVGVSAPPVYWCEDCSSGRCSHFAAAAVPS